MSGLALAERKHDLLDALRTLGGTVTVGDVVTATGMPADDVRAGLKALLEERRGELAVADSGELLYRFHPDLIRRGTEPFLSRIRRHAWSAFQKVFKVWIVAMLVVYFVVFVVLILAALFAGNRDGDSRGGWGGGRRGGHFHLSDFFLWYWIFGDRWYLGRPYYGHRWERTLGRKVKVPFYKKVFAFVFGPDEPVVTQAQKDRSVLRLIKARRGVLTTPELVAHTGVPVEEADSEMARLTGAYDGEPAVSPSGELAYAFPGLMMSVSERGVPREPLPAWQRLEPPRELTGNSIGANALVMGVNGFNFLAAASAPWFIFPRLGLEGPLAWVGLVLIPVVFSFLFFAVPGARMAAVARENRRRARRNVRKVLLGLVYERALAGRDVSVAEAHRHLGEVLKTVAASPDAVRRILEELAAEFEADVAPGPDGELRYTFPSIRRSFAGAEALRHRLRLEDVEPGAVIFDTGDSAVEASERDLAAFDRELRGYVPEADRIGYEEPWDLVAFDEELADRKLARR